ncbi:hypothetical protein [Campylobacter sp. VTCC 70190]|uniref:hypothetical protein n=1 Tax=Campylobacter sp. VTCC 70190 TaxID=3392118 RepID=UPI00398F652C
MGQGSLKASFGAFALAKGTAWALVKRLWADLFAQSVSSESKAKDGRGLQQGDFLETCFQKVKARWGCLQHRKLKKAVTHASGTGALGGSRERSSLSQSGITSAAK